MNLSILPFRLAVCRFPPAADVPGWAMASPFFSVTRTDEELSLVVLEEALPADLSAERGWRVFKVDGPLDFSLTGILARIANPLAEAKVSIFAISTFDTDYVLVKETHLEAAQVALAQNGFSIRSI